jgi:hypothetical protein
VNLDEVLAALSGHRDEFARSHGYDLAVMGAALRELDRKADVPPVCRAPRPPVCTTIRDAVPPNQALHQASRKAGPLVS